MRFRQRVHGELEEVLEEVEDEEAPAEQEQERIVYPARPTPWEERMLRLGTDMAHPHVGTENDNDSEPLSMLVHLDQAMNTPRRRKSSEAWLEILGEAR